MIVMDILEEELLMVLYIGWYSLTYGTNMFGVYKAKLCFADRFGGPIELV